MELKKLFDKVLTNDWGRASVVEVTGIDNEGSTEFATEYGTTWVDEEVVGLGIELPNESATEYGKTSVVEVVGIGIEVSNEVASTG